MKRYKLLKDLPFAQAGAIFKEWTGERNEKEEKALINTDNLTTTLWVGDIESFDEWFEEVKRVVVPDKYYYIDLISNMILSSVRDGWESDERREEMFQNCLKNGIAFKTFEEAKKYLKYLQAKVIIKQDTNGYKPNWNDTDKTKYHGQWDYKYDCLYCAVDWTLRDDTICFETREEIEKSFKKHPKEWKAYLTYEQ